MNALQNDFRIVSSGHGLKLKDVPEYVPYFFSVRHPLSRFRSGFYSRKRKGQPRLYNEWKKEEEQAFANFEHANDLAEALFRNDGIGENAFWAMNSIGHVRTRQTDWFQLSGNFLKERPPVWIVRQEAFENDFDVLLQRLNSNLSVADLAIAQDEKSAHKYAYTQDPSLSDLAKQNLEQWYRADLEFYTICSNWLERQ
ncbi:hypothetical protein [Roseibium aggregatum]|uniref:Sulfotransferase family protein n=1 Tax=Roseibium aggregatum TaxID=187304 RepID=A0A939EC92_9HYPH|nr:hypothetical protein [Roseibium aggregatum]MBN9670562.1 hypothetical protein [Roseibium aggregatum]